MNKAYSRIYWQNEPSIASPINDVNLNKMDSALDIVDTRVVNFDTTKADESDILMCYNNITYNVQTGVFVFTRKNGTSFTVDLNIEKIPVSFSMSPQGVITMETDDGTQYTADVGSLIKTYTFTDSTTIAWTVTTDLSGDKTVVGNIIDGSITANKLQPNFLADCQAAQEAAEDAQEAAETAETNAENSALDAEAWAVGQRNGTDVPSTDVTYENNAKYYADEAKSYVGAMGITDTEWAQLQTLWAI